MANGGQIDIKVNFVGLDDLDRIMQEVGQGATRVGQQVGQVGRSFDDLLEGGVDGLEDLREGIEGLGEGLGDLGDEYEENNQRQRENQKENKKSIGLFESLSTSLGQAGSSFSTMSDASSQALGGVVSSSAGAVSSLGALATSAKATGASFTTMLGPIGLVALGVFELVKAFREYSDTQDKVQAKVEAYKASLSEMTAVYETLATKQVELSLEEMRALQDLNNQGKIQIELAQELRETQKGVYAELARAQAKAQKLQKEINRVNALSISQEEKKAILYDEHIILNETLEKEKKLKEKLNQIDEQALKIAKEGYPFRLKFEQELLKLEQRSPLLRKQQAQAEASFLLQMEAIKNKTVQQSYETRAKAYELEYIARVKQINKMTFTDNKYYSQALRLAEDIHSQQIANLLKQEREQARARARVRAEARKREKEQALREEKARLEAMLSLNAQILQNEIRLNTQGFEQERALLTANYAEKVRLAKENSQKLILAQQEYRMALNALEEKQENAEMEAFIKRRDRLNKQNDEEIKMAIEKQQAIRKAQDDIIQGAFDTAKAMGESALASTVSAVASGESIKKVLKDQLKAIAVEATVQSALNTAKALGSLATGDPASATAYAKTALAFAGVAGLAGMMGKGGGASSVGSGGASPTGTPQVSTPEREEFREESKQMVFNISMGTVYSTEESALTALTSAITREQNRHRRGAPRNA